METQKHHYRNVFKSDHLGVVDLEEYVEQGKRLIFTIREVKQEFGVKVAGKKGDFNIAYFNENIKPLVLNAKNSKQIREFAGGSVYVENWKNIPVELYIDENVSMAGVRTGGVRIRPIQPILNKVKPIFSESNFADAKKANATIEMIEKHYQITEDVKQKYLTYETAQ